jgi:SAM-dependent methyltransferase
MGFDADWLTLREPADARARDADVFRRALRLVGPGATLLDLGCGTGATARAFAANGASDLNWRLLDNDPELLARAAATHPQATTHVADLADIDALPLEGVQLVTASALLDLVSKDWVARFAARLARARIPFYAVLSYDGRMHWDPAAPLDAEVTAAFNAHQRGDKGFGPALGPDAGDTAAGIFGDQGFDVTLGQSPWRLDPQDAALHEALLSGIAEAATEAGCDAASAWLTRRRGDLANVRAEIGHVDLLAVPRGLSPSG